MAVIVPVDGKFKPELHEIKVARVLSLYLKQDVYFLVPSNAYKTKTPNVEAGGILWEIKSPIGNSKTTIDKQVKDAVKQSLSIIIDGSRTSLSDIKIQQLLNKELLRHKRIKRLLFVDKKINITRLR